MGALRQVPVCLELVISDIFDVTEIFGRGDSLEWSGSVALSTSRDSLEWSGSARIVEDDAYCSKSV